MATIAQTRHHAGTFTALRHRNFRLYTGGQLISISGMWMQSVAQGWLIFYLTKSELALGLVACAAGIPSLFLSPFAGVLVDRVSRRTLLLMTHIVQLIQAFTLASLVLTNQVQVWHIVLVAFVMGISNSVDAPARQAFIKDMVGTEDLPSGININSLMVNGARVIGPSLAGILLLSVGAGWCFLFRGFSVLATLISLLLMDMDRPAPGVGRGSPVQQMREGVRFSRSHANILPLLLLSAVVSTFAVNVMTLLPAFADRVLHEPVNGLSMLTVAQGVGAVTAGLLLALLSEHLGRGRLANIMLIVLAFSMVILSRTNLLHLSLPLMALIGFSMVSFFVSANTMIQNEVPDGYRGRVMSLYTLTFLGLTPLGALALGLVADHVGTPNALALYGLLTGLLGLVIMLRWRGVWRIA
jgi:MFS family permease